LKRKQQRNTKNAIEDNGISLNFKGAEFVSIIPMGDVLLFQGNLCPCRDEFAENMKPKKHIDFITLIEKASLWNFIRV